MRSYNTFADFYDRLTQNVEYADRCDYIIDLYEKFGGKAGAAVDLACGTGSFSVGLAERGFDVTGIDLSEDMLTVASRKGGNVSYIKADMTSFALPDKADLCICMLDSINHLSAANDVKRCFERVRNALADGGIFIFDVNTVYKHNSILAGNAFVFDEDDFFLSWDNESAGENTVRILLDFFIFNGKNYDRYSEEFYEKAYEISELKAMLHGFEILGIYDDMTFEPPEDDSERIYFICRKSDK